MLLDWPWRISTTFMDDESGETSPLWVEGCPFLAPAGTDDQCQNRDRMSVSTLLVLVRI